MLYLGGYGNWPAAPRDFRELGTHRQTAVSHDSSGAEARVVCRRAPRLAARAQEARAGAAEARGPPAGAVVGRPCNLRAFGRPARAREKFHVRISNHDYLAARLVDLSLAGSEGTLVK